MTEVLRNKSFRELLGEDVSDEWSAAFDFQRGALATMVAAGFSLTPAIAEYAGLVGEVTAEAEGLWAGIGVIGNLAASIATGTGSLNAVIANYIAPLVEGRLKSTAATIAGRFVVAEEAAAVGAFVINLIPPILAAAGAVVAAILATATARAIEEYNAQQPIIFDIDKDGGVKEGVTITNVRATVDDDGTIVRNSGIYAQMVGQTSGHPHEITAHWADVLRLTGFADFLDVSVVDLHDYESWRFLDDQFVIDLSNKDGGVQSKTDFDTVFYATRPAEISGEIGAQNGVFWYDGETHAAGGGFGGLQDVIGSISTSAMLGLLYTESFFPDDTLSVKGVENVILTDENDRFYFGGDYSIDSGYGDIKARDGGDIVVFKGARQAADGTGLMIDGGTGNDWLYATGQGATIIGGKGRDYIYNATVGGVIYGDLKNSNGDADEGDSSANADKIVFVPGVTFMDAGKYDQLVNITGTRLTGGVDSGQRANGSVIYNDKLLGGISYKQVGADLHIYDRLGAYLDQLSGQPIKGDFVVKNFDIASSVSGWGFAQFGIGQNSKLGLSFKTNSPLDMALRKTFGILGLEILTASPFFNLVNLSFIDAAFSIANSVLLNAKSALWVLGIDPLVIDLDGDGIELTSQDASNVYFDVDGDKFAERTGWLGGDDGFLVLDANHNGRVDDISEMFGNRFSGGLDELAQYDSDGDGKITAADVIWAELKVWQDANQDGITNGGELKGLGAVGILEINLTRTALDVTTPQNAHLIGRGNVTFADGSIHRAFEAIFNSNDTVTKYAGESGAPTWATSALNAKGFGSITDLAVAMANDADLGQLASTTAAAMTAPKLQTLVQQAGAVLGAWGSSLELTRELYVCGFRAMARCCLSGRRGAGRRWRPGGALSRAGRRRRAGLRPCCATKRPI